MSIKEAIAHSISHTENVSIKVSDLWEALSEVQSSFDGETEHTFIDREGEEVLDVWGWTDKTPENESDFRLTIRLAV